VNLFNCFGCSRCDDISPAFGVLRSAVQLQYAVVQLVVLLPCGSSRWVLSPPLRVQLPSYDDHMISLAVSHTQLTLSAYHVLFVPHMRIHYWGKQDVLLDTTHL
jgi:hypothetical protein